MEKLNLENEHIDFEKNYGLLKHIGLEAFFYYSKKQAFNDENNKGFFAHTLNGNVYFLKPYSDNKALCLPVMADRKIDNLVDLSVSSDHFIFPLTMTTLAKLGITGIHWVEDDARMAASKRSEQILAPKQGGLALT